MNRIVQLLIVFFASLAIQVKAQVFWFEDFGVGSPCDQGQLATNPAAVTPTNSPWQLTNNPPGPTVNGVDANEWYVSASEPGMLVGQCRPGNCANNNRTLHISSSFGALLDNGADYTPGPNGNTNKRIESGLINCTGYSNIQLSFRYFVQGIPSFDYCEVWCFTGAWVQLGTLAPTNNGFCGPTPAAVWTFTAFALPPAANNNPAVRIGFRWINFDGGGADPGIAIDNIELAQMTIQTMTTVPCPQQTVTGMVGINAPGVVNYTWTSIPNTVTFTPVNANPTTIQYPGPGTYTLILIGAIPGGTATATATQVVTVNNQVLIAALPASQTVCPGSTATLTATGALTYSWTEGLGGPSVGTGSQVTVSFPTPSVVTYVVAGTFSMCPTNTVITSVTYTNIPLSLTVNPQSPTVCPGGNVVLTASGATSYTWTVPGSPPTTSLGAAIIASPGSTLGTYVYTVEGVDVGCSGTTTVDVVVGNVPFAMSITADNYTICAGQTVNLTGAGASSYTWAPPSLVTNTVGPTTATSPTVTTTYTLFGENGGCISSTVITVTVTPGPPVNLLSTANAVCEGYTSTLTAVAGGGSSYQWTGSTFTGVINQPSVSVPSGSYTVVVTNTFFVCPTIKSVVINTMAPLNIGVTQSNFTTCISNNEPKFSLPVALFATGGSIYNWAPCNGGNLTICIGHSTIARPHTTTQYTVTGYSSVCSGSAVITVTVLPQATISVQPPMPITCLGSCFNFSVVNTNTYLPKPYTYSWTVPNNDPLSLSNNLSPTVVACPTVNATYTVQMKDFRGCATEPVYVTTTIIPQPLTAVAIPTINGIPTNSVCFVGDIPGPYPPPYTNTLALVAINKNINPPLLPGVVPTYTWYNASTPTNSLMNDGAILTPTSAPNVTVTGVNKLPSTVTYTIRTSFNGINGCFAEDTVTVRVVDCRKVTNVTFTTVVVNDTICTRQCVTFTNTTDAGDPQTVKWTFPGGAPVTSTLQVPTICYNLPGKYNVILEVDNPFGPPVQTGTLNFINVVDVPNTTIIPPGMTMSDTTIRFGQCVTLKGSGAASYVWSPNYMISNLFGPNTKVCPQRSTQYILTGYNSRGCASNDTINVIVIEDCGEMFVPNAFSPNGVDHPENETLKVYGHCLETMTFQIFNRWGQKVFETTDQSVGWDGTFKGEELNSGVFVYRLEGKGYDGKGYSMKGNITLIR